MLDLSFIVHHDYNLVFTAIYEALSIQPLVTMQNIVSSGSVRLQLSFAWGCVLQIKHL